MRDLQQFIDEKCKYNIHLNKTSCSSVETSSLKMETFNDIKKELLTANSKWVFALETKWHLVANQEMRRGKFQLSPENALPSLFW